MGGKIDTFPYIVQNIMYIMSVNSQRSGRKIRWLPTQWDVTFSVSDLQFNNRRASAALPSSLHLTPPQEIHSGYSLWRLQVILPCLVSHRLTVFSARELYAFTSKSRKAQGDGLPADRGKKSKLLYFNKKRYILTIMFSLFPTFLIVG